VKRLISFALLMAVPALAGAVAPKKTQPAKGAQQPAEPMKKLLQDCDAHKFEAVIEATVDGQPHRSRMKLCGTEGQTDAEWLGTLKDALAKVVAAKSMPDPVKVQISAKLKGEIDRLTMLADGGIKVPPTSFALKRPTKPADAPLSRDYAALPPLQTTPTVAPPRLLTSVDGPALPRPRISMSCYSPGDLTGDGPCAAFDRFTMLTVRAGEAIPAGTSLRFVRDGEQRSELSIAGLARGKSIRLALPPEVCSHVAGGSLEIQVVRGAPNAAAQVVGTEGPFNLRC